MIIRSTNVVLAYNVWCYEQVCIAECFKLPMLFVANLLIYGVMCRFLFTNLI